MRASATRKSGTSPAKAACAHPAAAEAASTATATAGIRGVDRKCQREHRRDHNRAYQLECRHRTLLMSARRNRKTRCRFRIAGHTRRNDYAAMPHC
jgi:hypothetical protein